jgi:hypothetical protein
VMLIDWLLVFMRCIFIWTIKWLVQHWLYFKLIISFLTLIFCFIRY